MISDSLGHCHDVNFILVKFDQPQTDDSATRGTPFGWSKPTEGKGWESGAARESVFRVIAEEARGRQPLLLLRHPGEGLLRLGSGSQ